MQTFNLPRTKMAGESNSKRQTGLKVDIIELTKFWGFHFKNFFYMGCMNLTLLLHLLLNFYVSSSKSFNLVVFEVKSPEQVVDSLWRFCRNERGIFEILSKLGMKKTKILLVRVTGEWSRLTWRRFFSRCVTRRVAVCTFQYMEAEIGTASSSSSCTVPNRFISSSYRIFFSLMGTFKIFLIITS